MGLALGAGSAGAATPANPLPGLVVPKAQLGGLAQGLQIMLRSGLTTNARAADDSFDPNDTEASVAKAGRVGGLHARLRRRRLDELRAPGTG